MMSRQIGGASAVLLSLFTAPSVGAQMGQLQGGGPLMVPFGQTGCTHAPVQIMGTSRVGASCTGALSETLPASGGGAQVEHPQGEGLARMPWAQMGTAHGGGRQVVVPPAPPAPPAPPPVPVVIPPLPSACPPLPPVLVFPPLAGLPPSPFSPRPPSFAQAATNKQPAKRPTRTVDVLRMGTSVRRSNRQVERNEKSPTVKK